MRNKPAPSNKAGDGGLVQSIRMDALSSSIVKLAAESAGFTQYDNHPIAIVNDHVVRLSTMTEPYPWHLHPDSDESFLGVEGCLLIELQNRLIELHSGELFTVVRGLPHRTRPLGARSVNLTFERQHLLTELIPDPRTQHCGVH